LGARISQEFGIEVDLIKGANGIFEVSANGNVVFSKRSAGAFPDADKLIQSLRSLQ